MNIGVRIPLSSKVTPIRYNVRGSLNTRKFHSCVLDRTPLSLRSVAFVLIEQSRVRTHFAIVQHICNGMVSV